MRKQWIFLSDLFKRMIELNVPQTSETVDFELSHGHSRTGNFTITLALVMRKRKDQERTKTSSGDFESCNGSI